MQLFVGKHNLEGVCHRGAAPHPAEVNSAGPHPRFWGPNPKTIYYGKSRFESRIPMQLFVGKHNLEGVCHRGAAPHPLK